MTLRPILIYGDPCLTRVAQPVGKVTEETRALAQDLIETMYDAPGRGLAAPQVGESVRMFVIDCYWKDGAERDPLVLIDPRILSASDTVVTHEEACLSIPGVPMQISRPSEVRMVWTTLDGRSEERKFGGIEAVCIQHEYDHLDGILIPDRLTLEDRETMQPALAALQAEAGTG